MASLLQITLAVSIIIISYLLKKNFELQYQFGELKFKYERLISMCGTDNDYTGERRKESCICPCQESNGVSFTHFQLDSTSATVFRHSANQVQSMIEDDKVHSYADVKNVFSVEDYGRTIGYAEGEVTGSITSVNENLSKARLSPMGHIGFGSEVQLESSSNNMSPEHISAGQIFNERTGRTKDEQQTKNVINTHTANSVSFLPHSTVDSIEHNSQTDNVNEFYIGSVSENDDEDLQFLTNTDTTGLDVNDGGKISVDGSFKNLAEHLEMLENKMLDEEWEISEDEEPITRLSILNSQPATKADLEILSLQGTLVNCTSSTLSKRMCSFKNLCFNSKTKDFIFFHSQHSLFINVPPRKQNSALLELSTVAGHNAQYFHYIDIPAEKIGQFNVELVPGMTTIFKRFKPDNIMHVLHDDIIPLFSTLQHLEVKSEKKADAKFLASLFLADDNREGEFFGLYQTFTAVGAFTMESIISEKNEKDLICFQEAHAGLSRNTTWYQYGFFQPQGPITNPLLTSAHIHSASTHLLNHLASNCPLCSANKYLVLISRKETRLILNEIDLIFAISKEFRLKVMSVSLETHSLADMISLIHNSCGIIGMHGSLLSLAMFLRQGSIAIELFPYAVNPSKYTPYKTLCEIPGMNIAYRSWTNPDPRKTVSHPDWPPELGGIQHLPLHEQDQIRSQTDVPSHLCCEYPSWLYHIFQDTYVNLTEVLELVRNALQEQESFWAEFNSGSKPTSSVSTIRPGPVQNLKCLSNSSDTNFSLILQWDPPWNLNMLNGDVSYRIILQNAINSIFMSLNVSDVSVYTLSTGLEKGYLYRVWVRSLIGGAQGPFASMVTCKIA